MSIEMASSGAILPGIENLRRHNGFAAWTGTRTVTCPGANSSEHDRSPIDWTAIMIR